MQAIIAGAGGMLGWDLAKSLRVAYGDTQVAALPRTELDITREASIANALEKYQPKIVFNAAAYTNVDGAEKERDQALAINATGPSLLAKLCADTGAKLIHFSTDQVFDGETNRPRTEDESPNPLNYYAESKLHGEEAALSYDNALVLRVQWLYGERKDRFTPLANKESFSPFADQYGCPTWTRVVSDTLIEMIRRDGRGLYHFAHDDYASWADVFAFVKDELGLVDLKLLPRKTAELNLPAKRPLFSVMSNRKLCDFLGRAGMGSWKTSLQEFLRTRQS